MNRLTALLFTIIAFSLSGTSMSFASNMDDQVPQTVDLSLQEMNSVVGAGQINWYTNAPLTLLYQLDGFDGLHQKIVPAGVHNIGGHYINTGTYVWLWCQKHPGGYPWRQANFTMPNYTVNFPCYL